MEAKQFKEVCHLHNLGTVIEDAIKEDYDARKVLKMSKQPNIAFTHLKHAPSAQSMKVTYMTAKELEAVGQLLQDKGLTTVNHNTRKYLEWINRETRADNMLEGELQLDDIAHSVEQVVCEIKELILQAELTYRKISIIRSEEQVAEAAEEIEDSNYGTEESEESSGESDESGDKSAPLKKSQGIEDTQVKKTKSKQGKKKKTKPKKSKESSSESDHSGDKSAPPKKRQRIKDTQVKTKSKNGKKKNTRPEESEESSSESGRRTIQTCWNKLLGKLSYNVTCQDCDRFYCSLHIFKAHDLGNRTT